MNKHRKHFRKGSESSKGFTMIELLIATSVILVVSAFAIPSITRSLRVYQLNDAAMRMSGILKLTRFDAIRRNTPITCQIAQDADGVSWDVWDDSNGNGRMDNGEQQIRETGNAVLIPASAVPTASSLATAVNAGSLTTLSGSNTSVVFDQRGAVVAPAVYVFYIGNPVAPGSSVTSYRAVVLMPSGITQVWSGSPNDGWLQIN
jgi:type IV fimbrial biogenesis protein FimT